MDVPLNLSTEPWGLFHEWMALAESKEINDPNAMSLATVDKDGMPSVRIVLLKQLDEQGFVFFTNRNSRKGRDLADHPKAGLCLHWKSLRRQVRAEGTITLTTEAESDAYFSSRPRGSQIGAWASLQSSLLPDRSVLENRVSEMERKFHGKDVPRPLHWGGYRLTPTRVEFWQDKESRLHDRLMYRRRDVTSPWMCERLYP